MQDLYDKYVRLGYYERRHPVRFGLVAAIAMAAVISLPVAVYLGRTGPPCATGSRHLAAYLLDGRSSHSVCQTRA